MDRHIRQASRTKQPGVELDDLQRQRRGGHRRIFKQFIYHGK